MSYYRRPYRNYSSPQKIKDDTLPGRIDAVLQRDLSDWEKNFLGSLKESYVKYKGLTEKQHQTFQKVESRSCPKYKADRQAWRDQYTPQMRENMLVMARYYKANPPYFGDLADRIIEDKEQTYVPTEKQYKAMCENKYAKKVLAIAKSEPIYAVGTMVQVRANAGSHRNKECIVIDHDGPIISAAKNARPISLLPIGAVEVIRSEERYVKAVKK